MADTLFVKSTLAPSSKELFTTKIRQWIGFTSHKDLKKLLKNPEESLKTLEGEKGITHSPTNHHIYLSAVVSYLKHEKAKGINVTDQAALLEEWMALQKKNSEPLREHYKEAKPTTRQAEKATVKWEDIVTKRDALPAGIPKVLLGFYTYLDPVRADFFATELVLEGEPTQPNYIRMKERKLVLTDFKTKKKYDKIEQTIPGSLMKDLEESLKTVPRRFLFTKPETPDEPFDRAGFSNWACRTLTRVLGTPMTLTALRHLYVSTLDFNQSAKKLNVIASHMGHSIGMQKGYEWNAE